MMVKYSKMQFVSISLLLSVLLSPDDLMVTSENFQSCTFLFNETCQWGGDSKSGRCSTSLVVIVPSIILSNCTLLGVARKACIESAQRRSFLRQQWSRMSSLFTVHANARMIFLFGDLDMFGNPLPSGDLLLAQVQDSLLHITASILKA